MTEERKRAFAGVVLIFGTYFYFLIFAQFAFLELALRSGSADALKPLMALMALGGLLGSFLVPWMRIPTARLLRGSLAACFATALAAPASPAGVRGVVALAIGLSVGVLTVSLATTLRTLFTPRSWGWGAALGTGLAYFLCNVPAVFQSSPQSQSVLAGLVCLASAMVVPRFAAAPPPTVARHPSSALPFFLLFFGILVWLDSASFYIIQHSPLKEGTWSTSSNLWRNAWMHLAGALAGGWLARHQGFRAALAGAFLLLAPAALFANADATRSLAGWLYPAGVSIYSASLVSFPCFGPGEKSPRSIAVRAALLYTLSGWICSGLGIGMAENLHRVPWQFAAGSGALLLLAGFARAWVPFRREIAYAGLILAPAIAFSGMLPRPGAEPASPGRAVYLAEGCINCHTQYPRPASRDELLWGPSQPLDSLLAQTPPLFGNRRQGPDLLNVGGRRSRAWLKQHFIDPRSLAPGSSMPSYASLFRDDRGEALLDYLTAPPTNAILARLSTLQNWHLDPNGPTAPSADVLFARHCAACHGAQADGNGPLRDKFPRRPANLVAGPWIYAPPGLPAPARKQHLARIVKFGIPGTDMPGHEYFSDAEVLALTLFVEKLNHAQ